MEFQVQHYFAEWLRRQYLLKSYFSTTINFHTKHAFQVTILHTPIVSFRKTNIRDASATWYRTQQTEKCIQRAHECYRCDLTRRRPKSPEETVARASLWQQSGTPAPDQRAARRRTTPRRSSPAETRRAACAQ